MAERDEQTVVVGSGAAGLFTALVCGPAGPVIVLTQGAALDSNTRWAQGGIAAALGPDDSPDLHFADTVAAGAGLVDEEAARILCQEAPARVRDLQAAGVIFDGDGANVSLGREAAHSRSRIVHAGGDRTGAGIEAALLAAVRAAGVEIREHVTVERLLIEEGRCIGVETNAGAIRGRATVLATGGAGQLYSHTTNPPGATGRGLVLAFEAGAELADLEFFQFHPTAARVPGAQAFLISEAVRGEGAVLRNRAGEAFMVRYTPERELAPRDVVARSIAREMERTGEEHVWLDCTGIEHVDLRERFPGIFAWCSEHGIDIRRQLIPVAPAAHYFMGGVRTDLDGRTTVPGLFAAGEAACTGVHGANRLASNSLLETVVFGQRVAEAIRRGDTHGAARTPGAEALPITPAARTPAFVRRLMWAAAGIERDATGLGRARAELSRTEPGGDAALTLLARLVVEAALRREESRGAHYRADFPERDDRHWRRRQVFHRAD